MLNMLKRLTLASFVAVAAAGSAAPLAHATDVESVVTDQSAPAPSSSGQFVRIGLNKSIVVRLPAEARDVIVGDPATVDAVVRRKNMAYIFARGVGQTNIFFFDANGNQILNLDVEVAIDSLALKKLLQRVMPGNRITVDTVNRDVILGGFVKNGLEAKKVMDIASKFVDSGGGGSGAAASGGGTVNVVDTMKISGEDQVMLKVKIVEIQRDVLRQMGIDLQKAFTMGETVFNLASINPFDLGGALGNSAFAGGAQAIDNTGTSKFGALLKALERDGLSHTLAEPNLTTVNGQPAKFNAGGEIPISQCTGGTSTTAAQCGTAYRPYGVGLGFTPVLMDDGRIHLNINTEISELSGISVNGSPGFTTRTADTSVELPNGGSMMIAGLIKDTSRQNVNGFPGLKKLPVLGALFRSKEYQANETELVVIVTPYLVKPVAERLLATPDKNFNPAGEGQSLFFGKLNKTYGVSGKAPAGGYKGNVGFIVE